MSESGNRSNVRHQRASALAARPDAAFQKRLSSGAGRKALNEVDRAVYSYFRAYIEREGYAPNNSAAARDLKLGVSTVQQSIARLAALGFLTFTPRRWSSVKILHRTCGQCGEEIMPVNAAFLTANHHLYVRGKCRSCYRHQQNEAVRDWHARNPGYHMRLMRKLRSRQRLTVKQNVLE